MGIGQIEPVDFLFLKSFNVIFHDCADDFRVFREWNGSVAMQNGVVRSLEKIQTFATNVGKSQDSGCIVFGMIS